MLFFSRNTVNINDSISLYKGYITKNRYHVDDVCNMIIDIANEIRYHMDNGLKPNQVYKEFYRLVSLFYCGKADALQDFWMGEWNTTMTDEEKIFKIYEELFKYIGFHNGDDVEYEYDNEILWKMQKEFIFLQGEEFIDKRFDYFIKSIGSRMKISNEIPTTSYYFDTNFYNKKESSFKISHYFKFSEDERKLSCDSEITFYSPKNIGVTRQLTVFCKCSCNLNKRLNYTKDENLELDKWLLRKVSFLRFLEIVDQCKQDRSWKQDDYINTYWIYIYANNSRNKIKLG